MKFKLLAKDSSTSARRGRITTAHGPIETPVFMPVGTQATVKAIDLPALSDLGADIILSNTYHLNLRPTSELIRDLGGLHKFMGWDKSILTDSGGFQLFSMKDVIKVSEEGVNFQSHINGSKHFMSPERCIEIQKNLGVDIMMVLDHLTPPDISQSLMLDAMSRTSRWAKRCFDYHQENPTDQAIFAIQQGAFSQEMRQQSAEELQEFDFDGFAVGGLSVGEEKSVMQETATFSVGMLPEDKPRYVMGVGTPADLLFLVGLGYDMFDCVLPTRTARTGKLYTSRGSLNIKNSRYTKDGAPLDPDCSCIVCQKYSRAYLRHLFIAKEVLAVMLNTHHNLHFFLNMMREARQAIEDKDFINYSRNFLAKFAQGIDG
jgi:queuine tRNA-ribosyltransferase